MDRLKDVSHTDGVAIRRIEPVLLMIRRISRRAGHRCPRYAQAIVQDGREPATTSFFGADDFREDAVGHAGAREVTRHRRKGNDHLVIVPPVVGAVLILLSDAADDRVGNPIQLHGLADAVAGAEQLLRRIRAPYCDAPRLGFVGVAERSSAIDVDRADLLVLRLDAVDGDCPCVVGAFDVNGAALNLGADDRDHR